MTEITDTETAEIQWASSEEGEAAVRAAWAKTKALGLGTRAVDRADIGAIVYAAHLAAEAERKDEHENAEKAARDGALNILLALRNDAAALDMRLRAGDFPAGGTARRLGELIAWLAPELVTLETLRDVREWDEAERNGEQS